MREVLHLRRERGAKVELESREVRARRPLPAARPRPKWPRVAPPRCGFLEKLRSCRGIAVAPVRSEIPVASTHQAARIAMKTLTTRTSRMIQHLCAEMPRRARSE